MSGADERMAYLITRLRANCTPLAGLREAVAIDQGVEQSARQHQQGEDYIRRWNDRTAIR